MKTELKRFLGSGFALLMLISVALALCVAWRGAYAQQNAPSPGTISTNPEAAQAERDWDSAIASALTAAHNLSDAQQNGSSSATITDLQSKYEQAVKAANDAWDRFQSCLPQSQRCLLNSDLTPQAPANNSNSSNKASQPSTQQGSSSASDDESETCDCDLLRWEAERAEASANDASFYDSSYEQRYGHRDPGRAARADAAKEAARAAWAKYRTCKDKPACPPSHSSALPDQRGLLGLFQFFFGVPEVDGPPGQAPSPPANLFDDPSLLRDLDGEEGRHPDAPGHIIRDEFGNLSIQCDEDRCSATESPLQLTPAPKTEPAKPPAVQPSSAAPSETQLHRAGIEYQIIGDWRLHGGIKYRVFPVGGRSFTTIPLAYERQAPANDSILQYRITLPTGQTYGLRLPATPPPSSGALAVAALNALDWSMSRHLSLASGYSASGASSGLSLPGELVLTALTGSPATNVAEHGEVVGPSQEVVVGEESAGSSARPTNPSAGNFVLAAFRIEQEFFSPRLPLSETSSGTIYSIISNGRSSGQALELQAYDPAGKVKRVILLPGTVLEPVRQSSAKPVADRLPRNTGLIKQPLNAYCLEFSKLPPEQGMFFRIAPQSAQEKFQSIRSVLRAAHKLGVDDDTTQYSVWAAVGQWNALQFADRFVEHSRKNAEAMNVKWTPQFESAVRAIVPERWRTVSMVLQEAGTL